MERFDELRIYHIVHVDRLPSILADGWLWCDATMVRRSDVIGTGIGMSRIKQRRLTTELASHPGLHVGDCVPFYFCPRSVMLYVIHRANDSDLAYKGGQRPIVHLECGLMATVEWANSNNLRWAFTLQNAGSKYFDDRASLSEIGELDWPAISDDSWGRNGNKEGKQAEFLVETCIPWELVRRVGVVEPDIGRTAFDAMRTYAHQPPIDVVPGWYY